MQSQTTLPSQSDVWGIFAPSSALPCSNPQREALPIASDAERTLPNARRTVAGRA